MGRSSSSSTIEEEHNCAQLYQLSTLAGRVKNPIWLAEKVLENSPHSLLVSAGAERFAVSQGIDLVSNESLISQDAKKAWEFYKNHNGSTGMGPLATSEGIISNELGQESHDTVGAVVMDFEGHVSAATSTGGLNGKAKGRIGDSPLAGAGLFADDKLGNFTQLWMKVFARLARKTERKIVCKARITATKETFV